MKNMKKLVAALAAATMVMSMGFSAFAEVITPGKVVDEDGAMTHITFVVDGEDISKSSESQITLLAYLIPEKDSNGVAYTAETIPAYSNQTIVALNQVGGSAGFGQIPVDTEKLEAGYAIAVNLGGSDGTVAQGIITYSVEEEVPVITVTFMNGAATFATAEVDENGNVTLPETNPTLDPVDGYATTAYTFVEWVDGDGNAFDGTAVEANTTVYPKFESNFTTGDVTGDGKVLAADRGKINNYIKNKTNQDVVAVKISHLLPETVVTGDISGDGKVLAADRGKINNYIKNKTNQDVVAVKIHVINR